ncbi:Hint domain-containing protein [Oecophyllibacter saccharovorans]|nr:Hint domain-containing protein [Oecophyllibacter saccharovorans]
MAAIIPAGTTFGDATSPDQQHAMGTYTYNGPKGQGDAFDWSGNPQFNYGPLNERYQIQSLTFDSTTTITQVGQIVTAHVVNGAGGEVDMKMAFVGYKKLADGNIVLLFSPQGEDGTSSLVPGDNYIGITASSVQNMDANSYVGPQNQPDGKVTPHPPAENDTGMNAATPGVPDVIVCFLAGSLIETAEGYRAVESLKAGDQVATWQDGRKGFAPLQALVRKTVSQASLDEQPVTFRKDSLGDNVPMQDLTVTPEHCMYFDGRFVPARMLVNGSSIIRDVRQSAFDVYHVELQDHAVINANGAMTESYLDTPHVMPAGTAFQIHSVGSKSWEDAAAPLCVETAFVQPLYERLQARAQAAGYAAPAQPVLSSEPDLYLETKDGQRLSAQRRNGNWVTFEVPASATGVYVCSRTARPDQTVGPFVDDRRHLGVLVGQVRGFAGDESRDLSAHLQQADLAGWDVVEQTPCRWTNGRAWLPLSADKNAASQLVGIEVLAAGPYLLQAENDLSVQPERLAVAG